MSSSQASREIPSATSPTPTFLGLPLEIREQIISNLITGYNPAPDTACNLIRRRLDRTWNATKDVFYQDKPLVLPPLWPLLLVNKRLQNETMDRLALESRITKSAPHAVDIMIVNERNLWPTWIKQTATIDGCRAKVDEVYVSLRPMCAKIDTFDGTDGFKFEGQPMAHTDWLIDRIMEILKKGLAAEPFEGAMPKAGGFAIQQLVLDTVTPDVPLYLISHPDESEPFFLNSMRQRRNLAFIMDPERVATDLRDNINRVLKIEFTNALGTLLYSRIGSLKLCLEGVIVQEWNLTELLAELRDPGHGVLPRGNPFANFTYTPNPRYGVGAFGLWRFCVDRSRENVGLEIAFE